MAIIDVSYRHKPGKYRWMKNTVTGAEWEDKPAPQISKIINAGKKKPATKKVAKKIVKAAEIVAKNGDPLDD